MVVCKFFQQGRCRYGDSCHNEHPQANRFAPLANQGGSGAFGSRGRVNGNAEDNPFFLLSEDIRWDLTWRRDNEKGERPLYPFGAYGPGKGAPKQLIEGELEQSPEELRVQAYLANSNGQLPQFQAQYAQLENLMNTKVQNILQNTEDARRFAGDTSHPNRNDSNIKPAGGTWPYRLGQTQSSSSSGFGMSAQPSQPSSAFGAASRPGFGSASQPAFGAPSMPSSGSAFGAPSAGAGGFGAPSALGSKPSPFGTGASAAPSTGFGAPSALGSKPSPFGATQQAASPFGATQQAASGFGAPSAIGARPSAFGAPQQPASGGFGAPSQPAFGSSGFGSSAARPAANPFAAPAAQSGGGFGSQQPAPQTNSSPFGGSQQQQAQTAGSAFGAPSAFGAARPSAFATAAQQQQPQTGLNRPSPFAATTSTFGATSLGAGAPQSAGTPQAGTPTTWKGHRVVRDEKLDTPGYVVQDATAPNGQGIERIWFLSGPPDISEKLNAMTEAPAAVYEDPAIGPKLKEIYEWTAQHGTFVKDGAIMMPEIPPKREWCTFEF